MRLSAYGLQLAGDPCVLSRLSDVTALFESESRRVGAVKELLVAEESIRGELAMDLHDDTIQVLTAANMELSLVEKRLDSAGDTKNSAAVRRINVVRHAHARKVVVRICERDRQLDCVVSDDVGRFRYDSPS